MPKKKLAPRTNSRINEPAGCSKDASNQKNLARLDQNKAKSKKPNKPRPSRHRAYQELAKIAFYDPSPLFELMGEPEKLSPENLSDGLKAAIQTLEIRQTAQGISWKFRFYNKLLALKLLLSLVKKTSSKTSTEPPTLERFVFSKDL